MLEPGIIVSSKLQDLQAPPPILNMTSVAKPRLSFEILKRLNLSPPRRQPTPLRSRYCTIDTRPTRHLILAQYVCFLLARPAGLRPKRHFRETYSCVEPFQSQFRCVPRLSGKACCIKSVQKDDRAARPACLEATRCSICPSQIWRIHTSAPDRVTLPAAPFDAPRTHTFLQRRFTAPNKVSSRGNTATVPTTPATRHIMAACLLHGGPWIVPHIPLPSMRKHLATYTKSRLRARSPRQLQLRHEWLGVRCVSHGRTESCTALLWHGRVLPLAG